MSWYSKACHHHGLEIWKGVRGLHTRPLQGCQQLCSFGPIEWHRACGRCGWSKIPSFGTPLWTAGPSRPAECPETWIDNAIWNGCWPWWWWLCAFWQQKWEDGNEKNPTKNIHFHVKEPANSNPRETNFRRWWFCLKHLFKTNWKSLNCKNLKYNKVEQDGTFSNFVQFSFFTNCILHSCRLLVQFAFAMGRKRHLHIVWFHPHSILSIASWSSFSTSKKK